MLIFSVFWWLKLLQILTCLTVKFTNISGCITEVIFTTFISELCGCDICFKWTFIKLRKYMYQSTSNVIVDSDIIWCKHKNVVCYWTDFKVDDMMKFVDFFGFFFKWRCTKLCDFFLADETFWQLRYNCKIWRVDKIFLTIYDLYSLQSPKIPNSKI